MMNSNPWNVASIDEFSYFNCPECTFHSKGKIDFQDHAENNHPLSSVLFCKPTKVRIFSNGNQFDEWRQFKNNDQKCKKLVLKHKLPDNIQVSMTAVDKSKGNLNNVSRAVGRSENPGMRVSFGGHDLPPLVGIGLTVLPKSGGSRAPPAPPGTTGLVSNIEKGQKVQNLSKETHILKKRIAPQKEIVIHATKPPQKEEKAKNTSEIFGTSKAILCEDQKFEMAKSISCVEKKTKYDIVKESENNQIIEKADDGRISKYKGNICKIEILNDKVNDKYIQKEHYKIGHTIDSSMNSSIMCESIDPLEIENVESVSTDRNKAADSYKHFVENQRNIGELETVIIEELADISEISGPNLNKNETQTVIIEDLTDISEMSGPNLNSVPNITTNELTTKSIEKLKELHQIKLFDNQEEYNQLVQKSEKSNRCYICKTNFFSEEHLVKHFSLVHEGEKPYQCNLCDVKFKGKKQLKKHLSTIHVGKIFNCPECQKKVFIGRTALKNTWNLV